eukprot:796532-Amphidinium_carterae.1
MAKTLNFELWGQKWGLETPEQSLSIPCRTQGKWIRNVLQVFGWVALEGGRKLLERSQLHVHA